MIPAAAPLRGLYAITDSLLTPPDTLLEQVRAAIRGGAALIQYRDKLATAAQRGERARELAALCRELQVPLIINDDLELASELGAGVHLGRDDGDVAQARRQLGPVALLGVSCYNDLDRARDAVAAGASYVAFGRFFPSRSKPQAIAADTALLQAARSMLTVPIAAIGGVTAGNGAELLAAGADLLAAIEGVFGGCDPERAARGYARLFAMPPPD